MSKSPFTIDGTVLTCYGASAAAHTEHVNEEGSNYPVQSYIDGVVQELDEAIAFEVYNADGEQLKDEFFIKVGPGTLVGLWAKAYIDGDAIDEFETDGELKIAIDASDGETYMVAIVVEEGFGGAGGMMGETPLWQAREAA